MKLSPVLIFLCSLVLFGSANPDPFPDNYFRSPLGIPLYLSGGFAEMRSNHFHGGLDIKTQGQTGHKVYGAADGWVSRIVISPSGYGNVLYVSHPNGYMTVYGHLDKFRDDIQAFMKARQYDNESFNVEYFPNRDEFPVIQGQEIARSGNTGGSAGPHLHFEIRDERTGFAVNPLLWGFDIKDVTPPRIFRVKVYALSDNATVRLHDKQTGGWRQIKSGEDVTLDVTRVNGRHVLSRIDRIEASGSIAFSVQAHDYHDGSTNRLGLYTIQLNDNDRTLFKSSMDEFSFDQARYINAHVDYAEQRRSGRWFQRSFVLPGNVLPMYQTQARGILSVRSQDRHALQYEVTDAYNNRTTLNFEVTGIEPSNPIVAASVRSGAPFELPFDESFSYRAEGFSLNIPQGALYENDLFEYRSETTTNPKVYSDLHIVHKPQVPIQSWLTMEIVPTSLPEDKRSKAGIVRVNSKGGISWIGGSYENGVVRARIRNFDRFAIGIDDTPPTIRAINFAANKKLSSNSQIRFRINDDLSGIKSYEGRVDGKWILFEYDAKYSLITYRMDSHVSPGNHVLEMKVTDNKDNVKTLSLPFVR